MWFNSPKALFVNHSVSGEAGFSGVRGGIITTDATDAAVGGHGRGHRSTLRS